VTYIIKQAKHSFINISNQTVNERGTTKCAKVKNKNLHLLHTGVVYWLGRPTGWVGLRCIGSRILAFWWVGFGRGSETFPKILKQTAEVISDNLIMINTDKCVIPD